MKRVFLDLDGVMADFDAHFPATFGIDHRELPDETMWRMIHTHPSYFLDMPLCEGAVDFFNDIFHLRPVILTACPRSDYARVAAQKRAWVRKYLSTEVLMLPVMGGANKPLFMHAAGDILIDDHKRNTRVWAEAGGVAILHRDFPTTLTELEAALA